ncbi:MAG TPA: winged helix-turn-helix domain-containing protein [Chloroflexota bacterium]|nr:winged helix-turn-helix domain-containing protein [Chloroflexota bacterium]
MAVPDFQSITLPLLQLMSDGAEHALWETVEPLSNEFKLTGEERRELIPWSGERRFDNGVLWAATYLSQSGLLEMTEPGRYRITARGREVLAEKPERVDLKYLERFRD